MTRDIAGWPQELASALHQVLCRKLPPSQGTEQELEPIVRKLLEATANGQLSITVDSADIERIIYASGWLDPLTGPLVFSDGQLFWKRWHDELRTVLDNLLQRMADRPLLPKPVTMIQDQNLSSEQQAAINAIGRERLILLSGGPGTGKTSTVRGMLQRAWALDPGLQIGLAAPTGKAARRLQHVIGNMPGAISCGTLHRWLQAHAKGFRRNARHPLNLDLLIVDEMSMVDLTLMRALLNALPNWTYLVLVGDPDQLDPVGLGAVWRYLQQPKVRKQFEKSLFHLQHIYRNQGDLTRLSAILRDGGEKVFWNDLEIATKQRSSSTISWHQEIKTSIPEVLQNRLQLYRKTLEAAARGLDMAKVYESPSFAQDLFEQLESLMVLCPRRHGRWSVESIHRELMLMPGVPTQQPFWPTGTPVICMENQVDLDLANGDLGVVIGDGAKQKILFGDAGKNNSPWTRLVHPTRLHKVELAYAMTIHKAQGSEADNVVLLWPEVIASGDNPDQGRLLYTAITRARHHLQIITPPQTKAKGRSP